MVPVWGGETSTPFVISTHRLPPFTEQHVRLGGAEEYPVLEQVEVDGEPQFVA